MKKWISLSLAVCLSICLLAPAALAEEILPNGTSAISEAAGAASTPGAEEEAVSSDSFSPESASAAEPEQPEVQPEIENPGTQQEPSEGEAAIDDVPEEILPPAITVEELPEGSQETLPEQESCSVSMELGRSAFSGEAPLVLEELPLDGPMLLDDSGELVVITQNSYQAAGAYANVEVTEAFTTFGDQIPGFTFAFKLKYPDGTVKTVPVENFGEIAHNIYDRMREDVGKWESGAFYQGEPLLTLKISRGNLTSAMIPVLMTAFGRVAYAALDWDTPEMFYCNGGFTGSINYDENAIYLRITPLIRPGLDSLSTRQGLRSQIDVQVNKLTAAVAGKSDVEQARYFHDWLCENNTYNNNASPTANGLPWSSASALLGNSGAAGQGPVCEGYARAFQTLCNKVGIPCILVVGDNHMWNNAVLGGVWTGVDVTWDDQGSAGQKYFMDDALNGSYGHQIERLDIGNNATLSFAYPKLGGKRQLTGVEGFVDRLYRTVLGREPDAQGFREQVDLLKSGATTGAELAARFFLNPEYQNKHRSNEEFLYDMYAAFFDRVPDAGGYANWMMYFDMGVSWEFVFERTSVSTEFTELCKVYGIQRGSYTSSQNRDKNWMVTAFANRVYTQVLERQGEPEGLNSWTGGLLNGVTAATMVHNTYFSPEYLGKNTTDAQFVTSMYHFLLDREPDPSGYDNWMKVLAQGHSRKFTLARFMNCPEFAALCAQYGIQQGTLPEN